jgi:hypothetical protein
MVARERDDDVVLDSARRMMKVTGNTGSEVGGTRRLPTRVSMVAASGEGGEQRQAAVEDDGGEEDEEDHEHDLDVLHLMHRVCTPGRGGDWPFSLGCRCKLCPKIGTAFSLV